MRNPKDEISVVLTSEELGWVLFAARQTRKKDNKSAERFGAQLDPRSSIAARVRVGTTAHGKLQRAMSREWPNGGDNGEG